MPTRFSRNLTTNGLTLSVVGLPVRPGPMSKHGTRRWVISFQVGSEWSDGSRLIGAGNQRFVLTYSPTGNFVLHEVGVGADGLPVFPDELSLAQFSIDTDVDERLYVSLTVTRDGRDLYTMQDDPSRAVIPLCYIAPNRNKTDVQLNVTTSNPAAATLTNGNSRELGDVRVVGLFPDGAVLPLTVDRIPVPAEPWNPTEPTNNWNYNWNDPAPPPSAPLPTRDGFIRDQVTEVLHNNIATMDATQLGNLIRLVIEYLNTPGVIDQPALGQFKVRPLSLPEVFATRDPHDLLIRLTRAMYQCGTSVHIDHVITALRWWYGDPMMNLANLAEAVHEFLMTTCIDVTQPPYNTAFNMLLRSGLNAASMFAWAAQFYDTIRGTVLDESEVWLCAVLSARDQPFKDFVEFINEFIQNSTDQFAGFIVAIHEQLSPTGHCTDIWQMDQFHELVQMYNTCIRLTTDLDATTGRTLRHWLVQLIVESFSNQAVNPLEFLIALDDLDIESLRRVITHIRGILASTNITHSAPFAVQLVRTFADPTTLSDVFVRFWTRIINAIEHHDAITDLEDRFTLLLMGFCVVGPSPSVDLNAKVISTFAALHENGSFHQVTDDRWQAAFWRQVLDNTDINVLSAFFALPTIIDVISATTEMNHVNVSAVIAMTQPVFKNNNLSSTEMVNEVTALLMGTEPAEPPVAQPTTPPGTPPPDFPVPPGAPRRVRWEDNTDFGDSAAAPPVFDDDKDDSYSDDDDMPALSPAASPAASPAPTPVPSDDDDSDDDDSDDDDSDPGSAPASPVFNGQAIAADLGYNYVYVTDGVNDTDSDESEA